LLIPQRREHAGQRVKTIFFRLGLAAMILRVTDNFTFDSIAHLFCDIGGMIGHAFEVPENQ